MRIVTASEKLSKRFFRIMDGDSNTYAKLHRYLDRKYPDRAEFSYDNPDSESNAFMIGLRVGERHKNWLMLEDNDEDISHTVFIPDTERDFAVWLIDNFLTEEE